MLYRFTIDCTNAKGEKFITGFCIGETLKEAVEHITDYYGEENIEAIKDISFLNEDNNVIPFYKGDKETTYLLNKMIEKNYEY